MKISRNGPNNGVATAALSHLVFVALAISLIFAPFAVSAPATIGCGGKVAKTATTEAPKCCSNKGCRCCMRKNNAPEAPQPLGTARTTSVQELLSAMPVSQLSLVCRFPFPKARIRFFAEIPAHYSSTPLAQSCIQLI
jgi:hypothetical protein